MTTYIYTVETNDGELITLKANSLAEMSKQIIEANKGRILPVSIVAIAIEEGGKPHTVLMAPMVNRMAERGRK